MLVKIAIIAAWLLPMLAAVLTRRKYSREGRGIRLLYSFLSAVFCLVICLAIGTLLWTLAVMSLRILVE